MNTVILTSVLSAGNHALFAGTRVLYGTSIGTAYSVNIIFNVDYLVYIGLSVMVPRQAPAIFSRTTANGVPLPALLMTSSISILCFGSSFIGSGALWGWLQNIVGVSNQVRLLKNLPQDFASDRGFVDIYRVIDCLVFYRARVLEVQASMASTKATH